jgi:hypothetical protein
MHDFLNSSFVQRWLWLCPALGIVLAAAVLMLFGFTLWGALLAAILLVCPALLVWGAITLFRDALSQRAARRKHPSQ